MKKFNLKINVLNPDFDAQFEKEWGFLERSYENIEYNSELGIEFNNVKEYRYHDNTKFVFKFLDEGMEKEHEFEDISILEIILEDDIIMRFVFSKSIISNKRDLYREKYQSGYLYMYLKGDLDFEIINDYYYIESSKIPTILFELNRKLKQ